MEIFLLRIEFICGILPRTGESPEATIVQNGPPGTFVILAEVTRVPPPTDQIVLAHDSGGAARVGFQRGLFLFQASPSQFMPCALLSGKHSSSR